MKKVTQSQVLAQVFGPETRKGSVEIHNAVIEVAETFTAPSGATPSSNWTRKDKQDFCREVARRINKAAQ